MSTHYPFDRCLLVPALLLLSLAGKAQESSTPSRTEEIPCIRVTYPLLLQDDPWRVQVANEPERNPMSPQVKKETEEKTRKKLRESRLPSSAPSLPQTVSPLVPVMRSNFTSGLSNFLNPPDNGTAIGNGKFIVHTVNGSIAVYDTSGTSLYSHSLTSFFGLASGSYLTDPRVIYDAFADRFIFVITGDKYTEHLAFSQTNDPSKAWNIYSYVADSTTPPGGGASYLDYPYAGINEYELFMQVINLSTQKGIVMQMSKSRGYSGATLKIVKHTAGGNACAVNYGQSQSPYGNKFYFVETPGGSAINLYEISDTIGANPVVNTSHLTVNTSYSSLGNASQKGTNTTLVLTDNRIQNAFYLNGIIHFGFMTDPGNSGYSELVYNRLDVAAKTITTYTYPVTNSDLAQPSVASFATTATDKTVAICYQESNSTIYPSIRVILCDDAGNWSAPLTVKNGQGYLSGGRWGDYTSCTRVHSAATPTVWVSAEYGAAGNTPATYLAEITINPGSVTGLAPVPSPEKSPRIYPNPASRNDLVTLEFELSENREKVDITIYDASGRIVKQLFSGPAYAGETTLAFSKSPLAAGSYFIRINDQHTLLKTVRLVVD